MKANTATKIVRLQGGIREAGAARDWKRRAKLSKQLREELAHRKPERRKRPAPVALPHPLNVELARKIRDALPAMPEAQREQLTAAAYEAATDFRAVERAEREHAIDSQRMRRDVAAVVAGLETLTSNERLLSLLECAAGLVALDGVAVAMLEAARNVSGLVNRPGRKGRRYDGEAAQFAHRLAAAWQRITGRRAPVARTGTFFRFAEITLQAAGLSLSPEGIESLTRRALR